MAAVLVLAASLSCSSCARHPSPPFHVVARLGDDAPGAGGEIPERASATLTPARHRWTAADIRSQWTVATGREGATFRSPELPAVAVDDIDSIVVALPASTTADRAILLWSDGAMLADGNVRRNRRELRLLPDHPRTLVIRGKDLRGQTPGHLRYLFLHVPGPGDPATVVESVSLLTRPDLFATRPSGRVRVTIGGEIRDVLYLRGPGRVAVPVAVPAGAELAFGLRAREPDARFHARISWSRGNRERVLLDETIEPGGWRDFRIPLAATGRGALTLTAEPANPGTTVLWSSPTILAPARGPERPNVVLYVVDSLRADRLGLYGYPRATTPFLDELGRRSLVFRRAYAPASWTKPSVASLLTSLYPQTHRMGARHYADPLPGSVATLQSHLWTNGYVTGQFSANAFSGTLTNLDRGFDATLAPDAFVHARTPEETWIVGADRLNASILPWLTRHARDRFFL